MKLAVWRVNALVHSVKVSNQGAVKFLVVLYHSALETKVGPWPVSKYINEYIRAPVLTFSLALHGPPGNITENPCFTSYKIPQTVTWNPCNGQI